MKKIEVQEYIFEELEDSEEKREFENIYEHNDNKDEKQQSTEKEVVEESQTQEPVIDKEAIQKELEEIIEVTKQEALKQAEALKEQAKKEGFELGYKEGYEKGLKESEEKLNKTIEEYTKKLEESIQKLMQTSNEINKKYNELENSATDAILTIVSKIVSKKIDEDKEIVSSMVKEALNLTETSNLKIKLNPEDAKNVEENIEGISKNKTIHIVSDSSLPRGSILIEEENGNIIDAGVKTKMEQVASSIKNE